MGTEMPANIKNFISFVESAKYWDSDCKERAYFDILNKMNSNEEVYEFTKRRCATKNESLDNVLDELCKKVEEIIDRDVEEICNMIELLKRGLFQNKKQFTFAMDQIARKQSYNYEELGNLMDQFGIIDIFLERNNRTFTNLDYSFLCTDKKGAMQEFNSSKNYNPSYFILNMKILFQMNKIAKFIDSIEFGKMLYEDSFDAKLNNEKRIKIMSNLKTEYLKKIIKNQECMTDEEKNDFSIAEKEYYRLFNDCFNNLNYEHDLEEVRKFQERKHEVYKNKGLMTETVIGISINNYIDMFKEKDIKALGMAIDPDGKLVLGMNIYSYPMPLTVHVSRSTVIEIIEGAIDRNINTARLNEINGIRIYKVLTDNKGKVFPTNTIYRANPDQIALIRKRFQENPNDRIAKFLFEQISTRGRTDTNEGIYKYAELLQE